MSDEPAGRGRIGVEIFEEVEKIVAAEGITRSEAFQRLSEQTGRRAGTVAANYYRIARQRGAVRPRGGGAAPSGAGFNLTVLSAGCYEVEFLADEYAPYDPDALPLTAERGHVEVCTGCL